MSDDRKVRAGDVRRHPSGAEIEVLAVEPTANPETVWMVRGEGRFWFESDLAKMPLVRRAEAEASEPTAHGAEIVQVGDVWRHRVAGQLAVFAVFGQTASFYGNAILMRLAHGRPVSKEWTFVCRIGGAPALPESPNPPPPAERRAVAPEQRCGSCGEALHVTSDARAFGWRVVPSAVGFVWRCRACEKRRDAAKPSPADPSAPWLEASKMVPPGLNAAAWAAAVCACQDRLGRNAFVSGHDAMWLADLVRLEIRDVAPGSYRTTERDAYDRALAGTQRRQRAEAERSKLGRVVVGRFEWSRPR